jgi:hypothetical protein
MNFDGTVRDRYHLNLLDPKPRLTELSTPIVLQVKINDSRVPYTGKDELECFPYIAMTMDPDQEHVSTVKQVKP